MAYSPPVVSSSCASRAGACSLLLGVLSLLGASPAHAAQVEEVVREKVIYQKKTVVSFEDDTVDGDLTRPDNEYIQTRKRLQHSNLIRIREDFRMRVLRSVSRL